MRLFWPAPVKWPAWFVALSVYNAECDRGLVHTAEYDVRMANIQRRFDDWARNGYPDTPLPADLGDEAG